MNLRKWHIVLATAMLLALAGCKGTTFVSSVPPALVRLELNITALFPHFRPNGGFAVMTFRSNDYPAERPAQPVDRLGYAGVIVWTGMDENYHACDMCCPKCVSKETPVEVDGMYAKCPLCGEEFDLSWGYATPTKGISKEALKKYKTSATMDKLLVFD